MPEDPLARSARGVYGISVASKLSGIDPQTLRLYERRGLLTPGRTDGGTRRYSDADLDLLARISDLVAQGINIAGIAQILHLQHRNTELESDNSDLKSENARLRSDKPTKGRRTGNRRRSTSMTLRWPMTFPPPTRLNSTSPPPTAPRTPASTRVVWLTFCSATPTRRM